MDSAFWGVIGFIQNRKPGPWGQSTIPALRGSEYNGFADTGASSFGVLKFMKSQIPSTKLQINYKFQCPMTKTCLELSYSKMM
jgi:hypothetical protein